MYISDIDFIRSKLDDNNKNDIIKKIIYDDAKSIIKKNMIDGENYYNAIHDTLNINYNKTHISETKVVNGIEKNVNTTFFNPNRSNHHNINPFHKILVDQKVSYIVGREPSILVKGSDNDLNLKKYELFITEFADEYFNEVIQECVRGASNKGFEVVHIYYNDRGELKYCIIPAIEIIPIYDSKYQNELVELIRYYPVKVFENGNESIRYNVEWWTCNDVTYFREVSHNNFIKECDSSPHWWNISLLNNVEKIRSPHSWGRVPFIILNNNRYCTTDLQPIKPLIDAYDIISSEGTNNFIDLVELYWVIQGYGGETSNAIAQKLKINKAVNISDSNGNVEAKQVSLPIKERIEFLNMLKHDIYHFGMGVDMSIDNRNNNGIFGNSASGVSLKFRYANLKHKAENIVPKLKAFIRNLIWFFTDDINRRYGYDFDCSLITISINYSQITDDLEIVDIINKSKGLLSDKTLIAKHPFIDDVNTELLNKLE